MSPGERVTSFCSSLHVCAGFISTRISIRTQGSSKVEQIDRLQVHILQSIFLNVRAWNPIGDHPGVQRSSSCHSSSNIAGYYFSHLGVKDFIIGKKDLHVLLQLRFSNGIRPEASVAESPVRVKNQIPCSTWILQVFLPFFPHEEEWMWETVGAPLKIHSVSNCSRQNKKYLGHLVVFPPFSITDLSLKHFNLAIQSQHLLPKVSAPFCC